MPLKVLFCITQGKQQQRSDTLLLSSTRLSAAAALHVITLAYSYISIVPSDQLTQLFFPGAFMQLFLTLFKVETACDSTSVTTDAHSANCRCGVRILRPLFLTPFY